jgi:hypothetical protein
MTDHIYRPISDSDTESETHATLPIESWAPVKKEWEELANVSHDDLTPDGATDSIRSRRAETPTAENASARPIVVYKSKGEGPKTLKQATDDLAFSRGLQKREALIEAGYTESEVQQLGIEEIEARLRGDPLEMPVEVKIPDKFGEEGKYLTVDEASKRLSEWRKDQAAAREQELAALTDELASRQEQQAQPEQARSEQQPEQPQQPGPVQQERQQVVQERQRVEAIKQLSFHEVAGLNNLAQLSQQVQQAFPELANVRSEQDLHNLHAQLQAQNPARAEALAKADQLVRQRQVALAHLTQTRKAHEAQAQAVTDQQQRQAAAQHDAMFEQRAAKIVPNWEQAAPAVRKAAKQTLIEAGISEQQIDHLWRGHQPIHIRSAAAQELILKAALWDSAQAKAHQIRQSGLPQVIRPGTGNANRANGAESRVADIKARLRTSKGNESIRLGTELIRAKRALNGA